MAHSALVISKQQLELDSRFAWTSNLTKSDYSSESVIVLHNSDVSDENELLIELAKLYKQDPNRKFLYINGDISPLLAAYFFGVGGVIIEDDFPLSDADLLLSIISDYHDSEFRIKAPAEQFSSLSMALNRILSGDLDEGELHEILTNPDWIRQVRGSMTTVSTALTLVDKSHHALSTFVDHARERLFSYKNEVTKTKQLLIEAEQAAARAEAVSSRSETGTVNRINQYVALPFPIGVQHVLYVKELSPCTFLTSFLFSYSRYLSQKMNYPTRMLVVQPNTMLGAERYKKEIFYNLDKMSITHRAGNDISMFLTDDPKQDIVQYFFNADCKLFIILDRLYQDSMILKTSPNKMKILYASNSVTLFEERGIPKTSTIAPFRRDASAGGFNIPMIPNFSRQKNMVGMYYNACKEIYTKLDTYLNLEVN